MKFMKKSGYKKLIKESYLVAVKNSVGSNIFRNFYVEKNGQKIDVLNNGDLSCAYFVSVILKMFSFIYKIHATVNSTVKDMQLSGWYEVKIPKFGDIIVWEEKDYSSGKHKHIGFYIDDKKAISINDKKGVPVVHDWCYNGKRGIEKIYSIKR